MEAQTAALARLANGHERSPQGPESAVRSVRRNDSSVRAAERQRPLTAASRVRRDGNEA
jgi:hypothetical protein